VPSLVIEPVDEGGPFFAATKAATIAAKVLVHSGMVFTEAARAHRHAATAESMHASTAKGREATAMEATTTLETTAMGNATSTAAPLGHGRPAERNGDHASHRNKRNRPHGSFLPF
jgi:hypothetical protein